MEPNPLKKIAVLTSGGDAPGMNAAVRSIVLTAVHFNIEIVGFKHGYNGLLTNDVVPLTQKSVKSIISLGGTILKSARCKTFHTEESALLATKNLQNNDIDALIVIGGDGSFRGAVHLSRFWNKQIVGVPGTIDNDIDGTDNTIGFLTATETALDAIDKIRDTADAFERIFIVEVMGRNSGFLALQTGIASAAEQIICPELHAPEHHDLEQLCLRIQSAQMESPHNSYIIVIAENFWSGGAYGLAQTLSTQIGIDCRPCALGHIQRGGSPSSSDRILATKLGAQAVEAILQGENTVMVGEVSGKLKLTPLSLTGEKTKTIDSELIRIQKTYID